MQNYPYFVDWESKWVGPSISRVLAEALFGMGKSFGIEMRTT